MSIAFAVAVHIIVSTLVLLIALAAATWIRPLTARSRHAILIAGMAALVIPPALIAKLLESSEPVRRVAGTMRFNAAALDAATRPAPHLPWLTIAAWIWLAIAVLALLRSIIVTRRLTASALRIAAAPPQRAIDALDAARRRLGINHSIDIIASALCEAPAVIRVLRPIIVLPLNGCETLDDEELESLLCHECAHVARRDNLISVFEAIAGAVFWFNPIVWLARRRIALAREAACDELVADNASRAETYVGALAKFCDALVVPPVAGVSCMASAHLKERIRHIMSYDSMKTGARSHRVIAAAASLAVALFVFAAGVATATPDKASTKARYQFTYTIDHTDGGGVVAHTKIVDTQTNEVIGEPTIVTKGDQSDGADITRGNMRFHVEVAPTKKGADLELLVFEGSRIVQRTGVQEGTEKTEHTGEKISMQLKDADIRNVLSTFADISGLEINVDPDVSGKVTMNAVGVPWDEALEKVIVENHLAYKLEGKKMHVFRK